MRLIRGLLPCKRRAGSAPSNPSVAYALPKDQTMKSRSLLIAAAGLLLTAPAALAGTLYSNNFETNSTAGLSGATTIIEAPNSSTAFLGPLSTANGTGTATLSLNTTGYTSLTISYDIYAIMTVDGDGPFGGNSPADQDAFIVSVNGVATPLLDASFANFSGDTQSYPVSGSAPQTGASAVNTLGYGNSGDATYHFSDTFAPTGGLTQIAFTGQDNQGTGDEYFGLDNIVVTGVPTLTAGAPEPGAWALMLVGLGGLGVALRASRRKPTALSAV